MVGLLAGEISTKTKEVEGKDKRLLDLKNFMKKDGLRCKKSGGGLKWLI